MLLGPILWAAHLAVIYGAQSTLCALGISAVRGPAVSLVAVVTTLATVVVLGLLAVAILAPRALSRRLRAASWSMPAQRFCDRIMVLLAMLSACGVIWAGATVLLVPACPPLR